MTEEGAYRCLPCETGTFAPGTGSHECMLCPAGKFSQFNYSVECGDCPQDTYAFIDGMSVCEKCGENEGTLKVGASVCTNKANIAPYTCNAGSGKQLAVMGGAQECVKCQPGRYSDDGLLCRDCPMGRYSSGSGSQTCQMCSAGTYGDREGQSSNETACKLCERSTYNSFQGASECSSCPPGSYCDARGMMKARECDPGTYSKSRSSTTCAMCEEGKYQSGDGEAQCQNCPPGRYGAHTGGSSGDTACQDCLPGSFTDYSGATGCTKCGKTEYTADSASTACSECSGTGQIGNTERTGCMDDPDFASLSTGPSLIEYMYVKGFAWLGAVLITVGFVAIVAAIQYKKEQYVKRSTGSTGTIGSAQKQGDDGKTIALMSRFQVLAKTVMPSYSFGTEVFVIIGFTVEAPDLAVVMILFRLMHTLVAGVLISALFRHSEAVWLQEKGLVHKAAGLHALMEGTFVNDNQPFIGAVALVALCDATFLQFFPWRNTQVFHVSKGFPDSGVMRWCLSVEVLQSVVSVACQGTFLNRANRRTDRMVSAPATALIGSNMAFSIAGAIMSLLLLCLKDGAVQRLSMTTGEKEEEEKAERDGGGSGVERSPREGSPAPAIAEEDEEDKEDKEDEEAASPARATDDISSVYRRKSEEMIRFTSNPMLAEGAGAGAGGPARDFVPSPSSTSGATASADKDKGRDNEMLSMIESLRAENTELRRRAEQYRAAAAVKRKEKGPEERGERSGADNL